MGSWIVIGVGLGVAMGAVIDNIALGIAIGMAIGLAIGAGVEVARTQSKDKGQSGENLGVRSDDFQVGELFERGGWIAALKTPRGLTEEAHDKTQRNGATPQYHSDQLRRPRLWRPGLLRLQAQRDARARPPGRGGRSLHRFLHGLPGLLSLPRRHDDRLLPAPDRLRLFRRHGVLFPGQPVGLNPEEITIASLLQQAGLRHEARGQVALRRPAGVSAHPARVRQLLRPALQQRHGPAGRRRHLSAAAAVARRGGHPAAAGPGGADRALCGGVRALHPGERRATRSSSTWPTCTSTCPSMSRSVSESSRETGATARRSPASTGRPASSCTS